MEKLRRIEGNAPATGGESLGWADESWDEWADHSLTHDNVSRHGRHPHRVRGMAPLPRTQGKYPSPPA